MKRSVLPRPSTLRAQTANVSEPEKVPRDALIVPDGMPVEPDTNWIPAPDAASDFTYVVPAVPKLPLIVGAHERHVPPVHASPVPQLMPSVLRVHASLSMRMGEPQLALAQVRSVHVRVRTALWSHTSA